MKVSYQLASNRFCVNSEQVNAARQLGAISARAEFVHSCQRGMALVLRGALLVCAFSASLLEAQNPNLPSPDAIAAPVQAARTGAGQGSQVDESIRFGVSARDLYEQIEPALIEVFWGGANSRVYSIGFHAGREGIYATVIPEGVSKESRLVLQGADGEQQGDRKSVV